MVGLTPSFHLHWSMFSPHYTSTVGVANETQARHNRSGSPLIRPWPDQLFLPTNVCLLLRRSCYTRHIVHNDWPDQPKTASTGPETPAAPPVGMFEATRCLGMPEMPALQFFPLIAHHLSSKIFCTVFIFDIQDETQIILITEAIH